MKRVNQVLTAMSEIAAKRHFKIEACLFGLLHEPEACGHCQ